MVLLASEAARIESGDFAQWELAIFAEHLKLGGFHSDCTHGQRNYIAAWLSEFIESRHVPDICEIEKPEEKQLELLTY